MPPGLLLAFAGLFGACIGSFLNVCIYRLPRECLSIVRPGSHCPVCQKPIRWFDNLPLLSYVALRGRCRGCGTRIPLRYPLVEALTAALFVLAAAQALADPSAAATVETAVRFAMRAFLLSLLVVTTFIDIDHRIIPVQVTRWPTILAPAVGACFPFLFAPYGPPLTGLHHAVPSLSAAAASGLGILAGLGIVYSVRVLGGILFRREAMGLGDVWFLGMLGGYLGWSSVLLTFLLACLLGAILGGARWALTGDRTMPFGPYLSLAAGAVLLYRPVLDRGIALYLDWVRNLAHGG